MKSIALAITVFAIIVAGMILIPGQSFEKKNIINFKSDKQ
jgi:hypothetical protein